MNRLVVVSNRVAVPEAGHPARGGLAVAVDAALKDSGGLWFGWSGEVQEATSGAPTQVERDGITFATVPLSEQDYQHYYNGFSNCALWPLFHYRLDLFDFHRMDYDIYRRVNAWMARKLRPLLGDGDLIWVHDFHLIPLGGELREAGVERPIGFFLHTPFPATDVLLALPCHADLLRRLCKYDLVGFQTEMNRRSFLDSVRWILDVPADDQGAIEFEGRRIHTKVLPIGIDAGQVRRLVERGRKSQRSQELARNLRRHEVIIGVDRIDYSKGLPQRFRAFKQLLQNYPETRNRAVFMQIAEPSRSDVPEYRAIQQQLDAVAGEIMGRYATYDWAPLHYMSRSIARPTVLRMLNLSRVGLVTPLRDGMNLVAKEFIAAQDSDDPGVLILSCLAGAAAEMQQAILVNPYDTDEVADAMARALRMPLEERRSRWERLMTTLTNYDVSAWSEDFVATLSATTQAG